MRKISRSKINYILNEVEQPWDGKSSDWLKIGDYLDSIKKSLASNNSIIIKQMKALNVISDLIEKNKPELEAPYLKKSFHYTNDEIVKLLEENVSKLDKITDLIGSVSSDIDETILPHIDNIIIKE